MSTKFIIQRLVVSPSKKSDNKTKTKSSGAVIAQYSWRKVPGKSHDSRGLANKARATYAAKHSIDLSFLRVATAAPKK